jgi:hypothetical protein
MTRSLVTLVASAALYGFSIGASHSWLYATRNLLKFPLLILVTAAVCAVSYFVLARFLGASLGFASVQRLVLAVFRDTVVLLASLSPVVFWLACTMQRPVGRELHDYPLFQGLNVVAIAVSGCLAVRVQARRLLGERGLGAASRGPLLGSWMVVSLAVGGQTAWYLRPFFGATPLGAVAPPFCDGAKPDFRGARSFYEACWYLVVPPEGWR